MLIKTTNISAKFVNGGSRPANDDGVALQKLEFKKNWSSRWFIDLKLSHIKAYEQSHEP